MEMVVFENNFWWREPRRFNGLNRFAGLKV